MRRSSAALLVCVVIGVIQEGLGHRQLQQFSSELGSSEASGPDSFDGYGDDDYSTQTFICYSPLAIVAQLNATDDLTYFQDALFYTGLGDLIADPLGAVTVLAPTDEAFLKAAESLDMDIGDLVNSPVVIPILLNHFIGLPLLSSDFPEDSVVPTVLGQFLNVSASNDSLIFSSSAASAEVIDGDNCNCALCSGVVDVVDAVLLPDILNITTDGTQTAITIGSSVGPNQLFVVVDESGLLDGDGVDAAPAMAPAVGASTSQNATGITQAPSASSSTRQEGTSTSTSTGMRYYNTASNS